MFDILFFTHADGRKIGILRDKIVGFSEMPRPTTSGVRTVILTLDGGEFEVGEQFSVVQQKINPPERIDR